MAVQTAQVSLPEIEAAAERIRPYILPTPLLSGDALGSDGLWLKAENLQRTGSFKVRGAFNAVIQLDDAQRARGVITLSAGNFGQALAFAAQRFDIPCVVVIREDAQKTKLEAIERFGAQIVLVPVGEWQQRLEEEQARRGLHLVHPFDDPAVINGQGTVGLEICAALPALLRVPPRGSAGGFRRPALAARTLPDLRTSAARRQPVVARTPRSDVSTNASERRATTTIRSRRHPHSHPVHTPRPSPPRRANVDASETGGQSSNLATKCELPSYKRTGQAGGRR